MTWHCKHTNDTILVFSTLFLSMYDNTVKTDSDSTNFRLLQTSLSVPTSETTLDTADSLRSRPLPTCLHNRDGRLADRMAVVASWLRNHAGQLSFLRCGRRRD